MFGRVFSRYDARSHEIHAPKYINTMVQLLFSYSYRFVNLTTVTFQSTSAETTPTELKQMISVL